MNISKLNRSDLMPWVIEALKSHEGTANIFQISKYVWDNYHHKITKDPKMLYVWQYEIRWTIQLLRKSHRIQKKIDGIRGTWELL